MHVLCFYQFISKVILILCVNKSFERALSWAPSTDFPRFLERSFRLQCRLLMTFICKYHFFARITKGWGLFNWGGDQTLYSAASWLHGQSVDIYYIGIDTRGSSLMEYGRERVVALVDMDCFYVQVEQRLDAALKNTPCVVAQYKTWKGGRWVSYTEKLLLWSTQLKHRLVGPLDTWKTFHNETGSYANICICFCPGLPAGFIRDFWVCVNK